MHMLHKTFYLYPEIHRKKTKKYKRELTEPPHVESAYSGGGRRTTPIQIRER